MSESLNQKDPKELDERSAGWQHGVDETLAALGSEYEGLSDEEYYRLCDQGYAYYSQQEQSAPPKNSQ